jgi:hypothetical protein
MLQYDHCVVVDWINIKKGKWGVMEILWHVVAAPSPLSLLTTPINSVQIASKESVLLFLVNT